MITTNIIENNYFFFLYILFPVPKKFIGIGRNYGQIDIF
jgi:hypothetical protein